MKKKGLLSQISTKPSRDAMKWAGKERSILASILLWALWACRVLSLLQICKLLFRKTVLFFKRATTDKKATRVNVPPMFCEIYFILWFAVLLTAHLLEIEGPVLNGFICYYLFESVVWVLYYTVFRRFFEENYSIYHELEYLTVLTLIIPTQALGFATLYGDTFRNMIAGLLGAGGDATPFPIKILGALFGAIVISMIISAFPSERIKKAYNKTKALVIGGGDVVENRLFPALSSAERALGHIYVMDLESHKKRLPYVEYYGDESELCKKLLARADDNAMVWIETPTETHSRYLLSLLKSHAALIVLEKPISADVDELSAIEAAMKTSENRERTFFLSYYALEKALPLNMLSRFNEHYAKYLDVHDEYLVRNWRMLLGSLESCEVVIHEGEDAREWIAESGGHLYETFLHNVITASLIAGRCTDWRNPGLERGRDEFGAEYISLTASSMGAILSLSQKKGVAPDKCCRYARFVFSDGEIFADFESQSARVRFDKLNRHATVSVKEVYRGKYSVMADLVARTFDGELLSSQVDGYENQIQSIRWLTEISK